jgi:hypothetical protein
VVGLNFGGLDYGILVLAGKDGGDFKLKIGNFKLGGRKGIRG